MKSVTELISAVVQLAGVPQQDDSRYNNDKIVETLNLSIEEKLTTELIQMGGEYLVVRQIVPLRDSSNNILYPSAIIPIPRRAYGRVLREVKYLTPGRTKRTDEINLPQTSITEYDTLTSGFGSSSPTCFFVENDGVGLFSDPSSLQGSLVFYYYIKISTLTNKTSEFAQITNASYSGNTFTLTATVGAELTTYCPVSSTKLFDIFRKTTGALFAYSVPFTRTNSTTFTSTSTEFTASSPTEIEAWQQGGLPLLGYESSELYLVPAESCQFSTIPEEWDTLLIYHAASKILESLGDTEGLTVNETRITNLHFKIKTAYSSRVKGERLKVVDRRNIAYYQRIGGNNRLWR
jgi:hypothetical protein